MERIMICISTRVERVFIRKNIISICTEDSDADTGR